MTDTAPDTGTTDATTTDTSTGDTPTVEELQAEIDKWKAQSRKHEERAKAKTGVEKELEELKAKHMTEQEKAVADAVAAARRETLTQLGGHLVAAEVRVAAAGRLDDQQVSALLESIDLSKFLEDDGTVDAAKVKAFVDGIAPAKTDDVTTFTGLDLGQGSRGGGGGGSKDPLLDSVKSIAGIR